MYGFPFMADFIEDAYFESLPEAISILSSSVFGGLGVIVVGGILVEEMILPMGPPAMLVPEPDAPGLGRHGKRHFQLRLRSGFATPLVRRSDFKSVDEPNGLPPL